MTYCPVKFNRSSIQGCLHALLPMSWYLSVRKQLKHLGGNHKPFEVMSPTQGSYVCSPLDLNTFGFAPFAALYGSIDEGVHCTLGSVPYKIV